MRKYFTLLVAAALLVAGCGNQNSSAMKPVDKNASPDVMVRNAVETRANLSSIAGKGVMRIVDKPNNFGLTVNADVVADKAERLRIRADKLAGAIQAFDVVMLGDDIGFYIPTQKTLYHGKVADLQNFSFRFDPDDVLQQMLRPETALLLKKWRMADPMQGDPRGAVMLEEIAPPNRPHLRIAINQSSGMIVSISQMDHRGDPVMIKRFDDYRNLNRGRNTPRGATEPVFPYLIAFSWPRDNRSMEMHFKQVEGDAVVLDEDFDIAASSDTRYLPLVNAQMDADFSDEPLAQADRSAPAGRAL